MNAHPYKQLLSQCVARVNQVFDSNLLYNLFLIESSVLSLSATGCISVKQNFDTVEALAAVSMMQADDSSPLNNLPWAKNNNIYFQANQIFVDIRKHLRRPKMLSTSLNKSLQPLFILR